MNATTKTIMEVVISLRNLGEFLPPELCTFEGFLSLSVHYLSQMFYIILGIHNTSRTTHQENP